MSPHQTIAIAVRLFTIWLAIYWIRLIPGFYFEGLSQGDSSALAIAITASLFAVACLLVLWFFPRTIARGLLPSSSAEPVPTASPDMWFSVGSSLLGLFVMTSAVPALIRNLAVLFLTRSGELMDTSNLKFALFYYSIEFVIGIWLILGARGVKNFVAWARNAGYE